jgi:hypothetical protein
MVYVFTKRQLRFYRRPRASEFAFCPGGGEGVSKGERDVLLSSRVRHTCTLNLFYLSKTGLGPLKADGFCVHEEILEILPAFTCIRVWILPYVLLPTKINFQLLPTIRGIPTQRSVLHSGGLLLCRGVQQTSYTLEIMGVTPARGKK